MNNILDIIVTHYNEPWEVVRNYFNMLDLQRGVDFNDIRVFLIHDGTEAYPDEYFSSRPYYVEQHSISHRGIAEVRNYGISIASAEWINFSDCDDLYYNVCGLRSVLEALPKANHCDVLAADFIEETMPIDGTRYYIKIPNTDTVCIHGKYYRLDVIRQNKLKFDPELPYNEDGLFNSLFAACIQDGRYGKLETQFPVYIWTGRHGSMTHTYGGIWWRMLYSMYLRDKKITEMYQVRKPHDAYCGMAFRTIVDAYYLLQHENVEKQENYDKLLVDIKNFYRTHRSCINDVDPESIKNIRKACYEIVCTEKYKYEDPKNPTEVKLKEKYPGFWDWVDEMDEKMEEESK